MDRGWNPCAAESTFDILLATCSVLGGNAAQGAALAAAAHGLPFLVAAPWSSIDLHTPDGAGIPIEERAAEEVTHHGGRRLAPAGVKVRNPAFDVTPSRYVTAIITERGIARAPYPGALETLE